MYAPDQETFSAMLKRAGLVPLHRTIVADLDTPLTIFAKVAGDDEHAFLFESMEGGEKWGRYSFIGLDPLLTFESIRDRITISGAGLDTREVRDGVNPLAELRTLLASFNASKAPGQWQAFDVVFRAPRFDSKGNKIENAKFVKVVHNGKVVHENLEVTGPTRAATYENVPEKPRGPLMLQGDHGPVVYRNIKLKSIKLD